MHIIFINPIAPSSFLSAKFQCENFIQKLISYQINELLCELNLMVDFQKKAQINKIGG